MLRKFALVVVSCSFAVGQELPELALGGLDPVTLCRGVEQAGDPDRTVDRGRYRYRFASDASRAAFVADPERFAIQLGGGCGRMGPLSGVGAPDRFAVHEGRIYVFASDGCRTGFLKEPERHLEKPDPVATGDQAAAARAQEILARAVAAHGGAERLDALRTLVFRSERQQEHADKVYEVGDVWTLGRPNRIRVEGWWGGDHRADVAVGVRGFVSRRGSQGEPWQEWDHDGSQVLCLRKQVLREPLVALLARDGEGFVAFARGRRALADGAAVDQVEISVAGATGTLGVDPDTGRVVAVRYLGRCGASPNGDVELTFSDFREVTGIVVPFVRNARFAGKHAGTRTWTEVVPDAAIDDALFARR